MHTKRLRRVAYFVESVCTHKVDKASEAESRLKRPEFPWITGFQNFRCFAESKNITIA